MHVIDQLDSEWRTLERSPRLAHALAAWGREDPALAFATPADLVRTVECRTRDAAATDRTLAALARRAPDDADAARVLLQLVLPGCRRIARRYTTDDPDETASRVIAAAWDVIKRYPIDRRPERIAANVLYDIRQRMWRPGRRGKRPVVHLEDLVTEVPAPPAPAVREAVQLLGWAVREGHVDEASARLIALTRLGGIDVADLAKAEGEKPQTLRRRRQRAEARLRQMAAA